MKKAGLAFALLATSSLCAFASPSADDAAKLQATLQSYFGTAPGTLTITPDGDGFKAVVDLSAVFSAAKANGTEVSVSPVEMHLTPDGTGKWKVTRDGTFKFTMKVKDQLALDETFENLSFQGTFDQALAAFSDFQATASAVSVSEDATDAQGTNIKADGKFEKIEVKGTGVAGANGGTDVKLTESIGPGSLHEVIGGKDGAPLDLTFKVAGADMAANLSGARSTAVPPLLKFMVDHPTKEAAVKDQQALKDALDALLPVFGNGTGEAHLNKVEITTPMGPAGLDKLTVSFNINGVVKDGHFEEGLAVEGLTLPPALVPAWATALVPKGSSLNVAISGFDAETPARAWLKAADFGKDEPVAQDVLDGLMASFLPKGAVDVTFNKTSISNDTYAFTAEGSFAAGPTAVPSGKAHITAKGLDDIMKIIQSSPPEAGLKDSAAVIIAAKGLGKAASDGSLTYDVEATPDGKVTVNGTDMSQFGKQ